MANIRIWLKYDGTDFHGYQIQKNGITIQETLEKAIEKITGVKTPLTGCSRTDAGVHAYMYAANFFSDTKVPMEKLPIAINTALPDTIRVYKAEYVPDDFHATFSAVEKTYEYTIDTNIVADPFLKRYAWHYTYYVDVERMREGAAYLLGKHDFSAFMASGGQAKTTVRTVKNIEITEKDKVITMKITADGFLYNMVRIIAGTLVYCGAGKLTPTDVLSILESKDRKEGGITAPPEGLKLISVVYED